MIDDEELKTLLEARARARLILDELRRNQREVEASPPNIAPERLAEGRTAMEKAIAEAKKADGAHVWKRGEPSLEDVFIMLMDKSRDNFA